MNNLIPIMIWLAAAGIALAQETLPAPAPTEPAVEGTDLSPALAALRIPANIISREAGEAFRKTSPVDRVVLGTHSRGTAVSTGTVDCVLGEHIGGAEFVCHISGTVNSKTRGINGPAVICATAYTRYTAVKRIIFDGRQLSAGPAVLAASTQVEITGIDSTAPGLRGRIVQRVARRRSTDSLPEAEAITRQLTLGELQQRIDSEFAQRLSSINRKLATRLAILDAFPQGEYQLTMRSHREYIEILLKHPNNPQAGNRPPVAMRKAATEFPLDSSTASASGSPPESEPRSVERTQLPELPLTDKVVLWLPKPTVDLSNLRPIDWQLSAALQFLPTWLSLPLGRHQPQVGTRSTPRIDLLQHDNWIGFEIDAGTAGNGASN